MMAYQFSPFFLYLNTFSQILYIINLATLTLIFYYFSNKTYQNNLYQTKQFSFSSLLPMYVLINITIFNINLDTGKI
jgi:uncharacterized membrane protein